MRASAATLAVTLLAATTLAACGRTSASNGAQGGSTSVTTTTTTTSSTSGSTASPSGAYPKTTTDLPAGRGGSAHVRERWMVDGATIILEYGRPALKGRPEAQMMPAGRPWRTGADAATTLTTDRTLTVGTVTLQPGSYTINTQPGPGEWQLILGRLKAPGQWGVPYQADLEIGRVPMRRTTAAAPAELVTFQIDRTSDGPALRLEWGTVSVSTPFRVN